MAKKASGKPKTARAAQVLVLLGSPRKKGSSATVAAEVAKGAAAAGAAVETVHLHSLSIAACNACGACMKNGGRCVVEDDMQTLYPKVRAADALVLASPIYWFTLSAQTKLFMDRCYALIADDALRGKRIGVVLTYGASDVFSSGGVNALRTLQDAYTFAGAKIIGMVYGTGGEPADMATNAALLEEAQQLGRDLLKE
jgi:multimeric flavodoxin WrbA